MSEDSLQVSRYEIRTCWYGGEKHFVIHDRLRGRELAGIFESAHDASVQCTLLWLEHLKAARRDRQRQVPLTSVGSYEGST